MDDPFMQRFNAIRIGDRYQLRRRLGSGTHGLVYLGLDHHTGDEVAIKIEHHSIAPSLLQQEVEIYRSLSGKSGFPQVFWHGYQDDYLAMVFELLGPNLADLFAYCGDRFSLRTTLLLMNQVLKRLRTLHSCGYLHRDIKPENFMMGTGTRGSLVYLADLGLASFRPVHHMEIHKPKENPKLSLTGTPRYASINGHLDVLPTCRDDVESVLYMALYFLRGSLPWQGLEASTDEDQYRLILDLKKNIGLDELCGDLPQEFSICMKYLREMSDPEKLDYKYICNLFDGLYRRLGFTHDQVFDWTALEFARLFENARVSLKSADQTILGGKNRDVKAQENRRRAFRARSRRLRKRRK